MKKNNLENFKIIDNNKININDISNLSLTSLNFPDKIEMKTNVENFKKIPLLQFSKFNEDEKKEFKRNNSKLKLKLNKNNNNNNNNINKIQNLQNKLKQNKNIK